MTFELFAVTAASGLAGFIDAIVGGGGLVLVPALFAVYPNAAPATLFGTNKSASVWGTAWATGQYAKRVQLHWDVLVPAALLALIGSWCGAWVVMQVSVQSLRIALPFILAAVLAYTLARKDLGRQASPRRAPTTERLLAGLIGAGVGFYDGLFGPGTGSFFVFLLVRLLGYDFLQASASAKLLNTATNLAALALFAAKGHVWWHIGLTMALANVAGSLIGTRLALRHGAGFVRGVFIVVASGLIVRTAWDAWRLV